ncbi:MAG: hypothetical protein Q8O89_07175 [Nanoarchaeota archaeon]|nr:hypothetical protein [Nanoarchaeota archaeon]
MSAEQEEAQLEKIAIELATMQESRKINKIVDGLFFRLYQNPDFVEVRDGKPYFNQDLGKEQKEKLADMFSNYLAEHLLRDKYGSLSKAEFENFKELKIGNESALDSLLQTEFGTTSYAIKQRIKHMSRISAETLKGEFDEMVKAQTNKVTNAIAMQAAEFQPDTIKRFLKKTVGDYGSPADAADMNKTLDNIYDMQQLLQLYVRVAPEKYRPVKKAA